MINRFTNNNNWVVENWEKPEKKKGITSSVLNLFGFGVSLPLAHLLSPKPKTKRYYTSYWTHNYTHTS